MLPDRVSNPGPLTYESGALPIALCGPAHKQRNEVKLYNSKVWLKKVQSVLLSLSLSLSLSNVQVFRKFLKQQSLFSPFILPIGCGLLLLFIFCILHLLQDKLPVAIPGCHFFFINRNHTYSTQREKLVKLTNT